MKKTPAKKLSHNDKAANRVIEAVTSGKILTAYNALDREDTTVGPYTEAVDRGIRFAVIGWTPNGRGETKFSTLEEAAHCFVGRVGSTRARDAAILGVKRAA